MKKKVNSILWWLFLILFLEIVYKIFVMNNLFSINTLTVLLFSLFWIMFFSILTSIFNEKINKILNIILTIIITLFFLAQIVYYNFYHSIFSFFSLTKGTGQVLQFWSAIIEVILRIWYIFVIILIPIILYIIFHNKIFVYKKIDIKSLIIYILVLLLSIFGIFLNIRFGSKNESDSLYNLIFKTHAPMLTINKTGLITMEAIDLYRYIFGFEESNIEVNNEIIDKDTTEYNVYEIDFDELISNTDNDTIKNLHNYFKNIEPTNKNEYTGLFKDKNLIFITAEAFDTIAIDETLTPTLYKMANNGFVFTNYYQPLYPVSTSDGEYMNLMSLIPKEGVWSFSNSSNNSQPFGFGNMFKKYGYISYGFHNHTYNFYDRDSSHTNIGLTYIACKNGLEKKMNCNNWPNSDYEMMQATIDYYINKDEPFATYYMTVSGHLNYNFYGNNMASKNKSKVEDLDYSESVKAYMATQIELDKAMEYLLQTLEDSGKLNDTLIVIAPDHYPYGLTVDQINEKSEINRDDKFELYHTSLIMYNPTIEKTIIDYPVSGLDLLPTIYNLFGIDFDSRFFMGRDIFSDEENIVIFSDRSWITSKGKYNSVNKKFYKTTDDEVSDEYIENINKIVSNRFSISSQILTDDYYKYLGVE